MRVYPMSRPLRLTLSVFWGVLALLLLTVHPRRSPWFTTIFVLLAVTQITTHLCNYWELTATALVQHGLFFRRAYPLADIQYAGPVLGRRLGKVLRKSIELRARGVDRPIYLNAGADRERLLHALHDLAPHTDGSA